MQLYVLDRAKNTLATTASFYNDKHHKELTAGASTFEFTVDKTDDAAQYMSSGNYIVYQDDRGRAWSFTILSYDETQTARTVFAEKTSALSCLIKQWTSGTQLKRIRLVIILI